MSNYTITIAGVGGTAPKDGFLDPKNVFIYMNENPSNTPTSYDNSLAKSRANQRVRYVAQMIDYYSSIQLTDIVGQGSPSASVAPTSVVFYAEIADINGVQTKDENNAGATLTGIPAVKRIVARALTKESTGMLEIYDPTKTAAPGNPLPYARTGSRFNSETVGALYTTLSAAEASITVAAV